MSCYVVWFMAGKLSWFTRELRAVVIYAESLLLRRQYHWCSPKSGAGLIVTVTVLLLIFINETGCWAYRGSKNTATFSGILQVNIQNFRILRAFWHSIMAGKLCWFTRKLRGVIYAELILLRRQFPYFLPNLTLTSPIPCKIGCWLLICVCTRAI